MIGLILAAGGSGSRFGGEIPKQFVRFSERPLYLQALERCLPFVQEAVIVVPGDWEARIERELEESLPGRELKVVVGGRERQDSVQLGLRALSRGPRHVLIHDAARPYLSARLVERVLRGTLRYGACIPVLPIPDTVKEVRGSRVVRTLDRRVLRVVQTPQGFERELLEKALSAAFQEEFLGTDEAALVERLGRTVHVVEGEAGNVKVTLSADLQS